MFFLASNDGALWFCRLLLREQQLEHYETKNRQGLIVVCDLQQRPVQQFCHPAAGLPKNNPLFPNLPVKYADLEALVDAIIKQAGGGRNWRPQGHRRAE